MSGVSSDSRRRTRAYLEYTARLGQLMYEHDPHGIGLSIGSPSDEYADEATRVAAALSHAGTPEDIGKAIDHLFPGFDALKEALLQATIDFRESRG